MRWDIVLQVNLKGPTIIISKSTNDIIRGEELLDVSNIGPDRVAVKFVAGSTKIRKSLERPGFPFADKNLALVASVWNNSKLIDFCAVPRTFKLY
jgi:hypothetical protein